MKINTVIVLLLMVLTMVFFPIWEFRTIYQEWMKYTIDDSAKGLSAIITLATWFTIIDIWLAYIKRRVKDVNSRNKARY